MSNCKKDHSKLSNIMDELPVEQGGIGRHKCAACAYEQGYGDGQSRKMEIDLQNILENLDISQAGYQRHKSAHLAYIRGYYDALLDSYQKSEGNKHLENDAEELSSCSDKQPEKQNQNGNYQQSKELQEEMNIIEEPLTSYETLKKIKISDLIDHTSYLFNDFNINKKMFGNRTYNILRRSGIITLQDVLDFQGEIKSLSGAGPKAELEMDYLKEYITSIIERICDESGSDSDEEEIIETNEENRDKVTELLNSLTERKMRIAKHDYQQMLLDMDNRNAQIFIQRYSFEAFVKAFCYKSDSTISNARGVGRQRSEAIIQFRDNLTAFLERLSSTEFNQYEWYWEVISRHLSQNIQSDFQSSMGLSLKEFYHEHKHLPFFKLMELIFLKMASGSKFGSSFIQRCFSNASDFPIFGEEDIVNETERLRWLRVMDILKTRNPKIPNNDQILYNCVSDYCTLLNSTDNYQYLVEKIGNYDIISTDDISSILSEEKCLCLNEIEALSILGQGFNTTHITYGGIYNDDSYEGVYLIKAKLNEVYNVTKALAHFRDVIESKHHEEIVYNIRDFVSNHFEYWKNGLTNFECVERIISILSKLLREELGITDQLFMDKLTLEPNTKKTIKDIVYDALKSLAKPSTPEEILGQINNQGDNPDNSINVRKVYAKLSQDERIVSIRFESRYDLVSNNPLKGSIRDFIRLILHESDIPLCAQDIYTRMPESRQTGIENFNSNLSQMEDVQKYIGNLFGLVGKVYSEEYVLDVHFNFTPGDKLAKITNFVRQNHRLPKTSDGPDWKQLRGWWDQLPYRHENMTNEELQNFLELKAEVEAMNQGDAVDSAFEDNVNQIIKFIKENRRMPSRDGGHDEAKLAKWYKQQYTKFNDNSMSDEELKIFVQVLITKSNA